LGSNTWMDPYSSNMWVLTPDPCDSYGVDAYDIQVSVVGWYCLIPVDG